MMTCAPRAASCVAAAKPIPRVAPVIKMIGEAGGIGSPGFDASLRRRASRVPIAKGEFELL
jgi:hypothetical protein